MRLLVSVSPIRWPEMLDVPTIKEQGFPVEIDSWLGVSVPMGTPAPTVKVLEQAKLNAIRTTARFHRFLKK